MKKKKQKKRDCWVSLTLNMSDGSKLKLRRTLSAEGDGEFFIDGKSIDNDGYQYFLASNDIFPYSRNFLISQGQPDSLMVQKPIQLTAFLEEISGSIMYKPKYDILHQSLMQIEEEISETTKRLTQLRGEKRRLRAQKSNSEVYQQLLTEIDALEVKQQML